MEGFCEVVPVWQFPISVASFFDRMYNTLLNLLGAYRLPRHVSRVKIWLRGWMLRGYILELGNVIPSKGEQEVVDVWAGKDCEWHFGYWVRASSKADAVGCFAWTV